jgi:hypothetical protein
LFELNSSTNYSSEVIKRVKSDENAIKLTDNEDKDDLDEELDLLDRFEQDLEDLEIPNQLTLKGAKSMVDGKKEIKPLSITNSAQLKKQESKETGSSSKWIENFRNWRQWLKSSLSSDSDLT